jgi:hypothetical protein
MLDRPVLRRDRRRAFRTFREKVRCKALAFREALDLDRNGIDGVLEVSDSVTHRFKVLLRNR